MTVIHLLSPTGLTELRLSETVAVSLSCSRSLRWSEKWVREHLRFVDLEPDVE